MSLERNRGAIPESPGEGGGADWADAPSEREIDWEDYAGFHSRCKAPPSLLSHSSPWAVG